MQTVEEIAVILKERHIENRRGGFTRFGGHKKMRAFWRTFSAKSRSRGWRE